MLDVLELLLSWRASVGFVATGFLCWFIVSMVPNETAQLVICVPVALVGAILSIRWQVRGDSGK